MNIPITGFIMNAGDDDPQHSHKLFITSWNGRAVHVHSIAGVTSINDGHSHSYANWTAPAQTGVPHTHSYYMVTSLDQGHTHIIQGTTSPAISLPGGGHYHRFDGYTTVSGRSPHSHAYGGTTGDEVSM
jgi:hypothetical protein